MVGGKVIGVVHRKDGTTLVHVGDFNRETGKLRNTCSVNCRGDRRLEIKPGDSFWWQCGRCYWTPKKVGDWHGKRCHVDYDIELEKVGYSH